MDAAQPLLEFAKLASKPLACKQQTPSFKIGKDADFKAKIPHFFYKPPCNFILKPILLL